MEPEIQKLLHSFFDKFELKLIDKGKTIIRPTDDKNILLDQGSSKNAWPFKKRSRPNPKYL